MGIGDYVRTPKGIGRINQMYSDRKDSYIYLDCGITIDYITKDFTEEEINKMYPSSPQIIDLIEVGDYVNGKKVQCFRKENCDYDIGFQYDDDWGQWYGIDFDDIKTIVTHEQMEAMQYRVEE